MLSIRDEGTVNEDGMVYVEVTKVGSESASSQIIQLAGKLHKDPKPRISSSMDGSVLTFQFGTSAMIIAHPYALGFTTPTAAMSSL